MTPQARSIRRTQTWLNDAQEKVVLLKDILLDPKLDSKVLRIRVLMLTDDVI